MTFEGLQIQGAIKIMEKLTVSIVVLCCYNLKKMQQNFFYYSLNNYLQSLSFQKINRIITAIDSQPMFDGGVLINVLGRLQVKKKRIFLK